MILNAVIYTVIGGLGVFITYLSADDAAKHIDPATLFWLKAASGTAMGALASLKGFISESFSRWKQERNGNGKHETKHPPIVAGT